MTESISYVNIFVPFVISTESTKKSKNLNYYEIKDNERYISSRVKLWNTLLLLEATFQPCSPATKFLIRKLLLQCFSSDMSCKIYIPTL